MRSSFLGKSSHQLSKLKQVTAKETVIELGIKFPTAAYHLIYLANRLSFDKIISLVLMIWYFSQEALLIAEIKRNSKKS